MKTMRSMISVMVVLFLMSIFFFLPFDCLQSRVFSFGKTSCSAAVRSVIQFICER